MDVVALVGKRVTWLVGVVRRNNCKSMRIRSSACVGFLSRNILTPRVLQLVTFEFGLSSLLRFSNLMSSARNCKYIPCNVMMTLEYPSAKATPSKLEIVHLFPVSVDKLNVFLKSFSK